jgi:predicted nucleic acid-binding protein
VRFWDASALVPTFIEESSTLEVQSWQAADPRITIWIMTRVEVLSAIARRKREQPELAALWSRAIRDVNEMASRWTEIWDASATRLHAERIVMEPLRTADALQLGAAIVAADGDPQSLELVTLDRRLAEAARREGFPVLGVR